MPVHDWTRVDAGLFHAFHHGWISRLYEALNGGGLPYDYYAIPEQRNLNPDGSTYSEKANRIMVRHRHGDVVAVIEIVSPGNKGSKSELKSFIDKSVALIRHKVHLVVIDLFPPTKCDPNGIHQLIWDEFEDDDFDLPTDKRLTLASYDAGPPQVAYVETVGVGDSLPDMPLFLRPEVYVPIPLDATYLTSWTVFPKPLKGLLEN